MSFRPQRDKNTIKQPEQNVFFDYSVGGNRRYQSITELSNCDAMRCDAVRFVHEMGAFTEYAQSVRSLKLFALFSMENLTGLKQK